jgi:hypothetical protein
MEKASSKAAMAVLSSRTSSRRSSEFNPDEYTKY